MSKSVKTCTTCGRVLPLSDFYEDRRNRDGLYSECKQCVKARRKADRPRTRQTVAAWREANRERERARVTAWQQANRERTRERQRRYREANRERIRERDRARYRPKRQGGT